MNFHISWSRIRVIVLLCKMHFDSYLTVEYERKDNYQDLSTTKTIVYVFTIPNIVTRVMMK